MSEFGRRLVETLKDFYVPGHYDKRVKRLKRVLAKMEAREERRVQRLARRGPYR